MQHIAHIRKDYKLQSLQEEAVNSNPLKQFELWWEAVLNSDISEPNAMTISTATPDGKPSSRIVLLKGFSEEGFIFFTNYDSHKGKELAQNPQSCLLFFWKELERQVRIEGTVEKISSEESDSYFNSRPEGSKIGAWASPQSSVIEKRAALEEKVEMLGKKFSGKSIDRPPYWGGYILRPVMIEFWQGRPSRLHDRIQYSLIANNSWKIERLAP